MPIVQRGSGYQVTVHHQGARHRQQCPTFAEAQAWELETKAALLRGEAIHSRNTSDDGSGKPTTLKQLFELTYRRFWAGTKGERTAVLNAGIVIKALGENTPPSNVTTHSIDAMIFAFESEGVSDSTINRRLSALSKMLTFALDRGYIAKKPKIERKKEPENRIRYFTHDEEKRLLEYFEFIGRPFMCDFVKVAIDTGARFGEIERIEARDLHEGVLSLWQTKSGKPRSIPLTKRAREVLERLAAEKPSGKLFGDYPRRTIQTYWEHARRHLGCSSDPQFVIHALRHTFCSRLVQAGVDIVSVSKLAGHSSIVMTMRYAHLAPDSLSKAIEKLEAA